MKKVIITGATSMLGAALVERLLKSDEIEKIYTVVRPYSGDKKVAAKRARIPSDSRITIIDCDINDYIKLPDLINDDCDTFYHMAWPRTATYEENIEDMLSKCDSVKYVIEAVDAASKLGCRKFIGAGSQSEYGIPSDGNYSTHQECKPVRADGVFHLAAGQAARMASELLGLKCIWMRIFSVYGINDRPNSMISVTIDKLIKGEHCSFTKSEQNWDYVYADDVAEAFYLVGEKINEHRIYNMAYGKSSQLRNYIEIIRTVVAPKALLGIGELEYPDNAIMNMNVDVSDLIQETGWRPQVDFETGIRRIYESRS